MTYRVTAVCMGNICRSPMAEAIIRAYVDDAGLGDLVVVDSAGTDHWHVGEDADPRALATLRAAGYDLDHCVRQYHRDWFAPGHAAFGDLVLAMDANNYSHLLRLAPDASAASRVRMIRSFDPTLADVEVGDPRLDVPDPYYGGIDGFTDARVMLEAAAAGLVAQLPTLISSSR